MVPYLGAHYFLVESRKNKKVTWERLTEYSQDEPIIDRGRQIRFVSNDTGYFWLGQQFGVSKDGGETWKIVDFYKESIHGRTHTLLDILIVEIAENGEGKITFREHHLAPKQPFFTTKDFGVTWEEHSEAKEVETMRNVGSLE